MSSETAELVASRQPAAGEVDAYERLLGEAMKGTRLSSPARTMSRRRGGSSIRCCMRRAPVYEYAPGTWGPAEAEGFAPRRLERPDSLRHDEPEHQEGTRVADDQFESSKRPLEPIERISGCRPEVQ